MRAQTIWNRSYSFHRFRPRTFAFQRTIPATLLTGNQLFTHADLMFGNECLGELSYEATTAAVFMAGLFLSFLVDYLGARFLLWRESKKRAANNEAGQSASSELAQKSASSTPDGADVHGDMRGSHDHLHGNMDAKLNVIVLEAGIIFHSLRQ